MAYGQDVDRAWQGQFRDVDHYAGQLTNTTQTGNPNIKPRDDDSPAYVFQNIHTTGKVWLHKQATIDQTAPSGINVTNQNLGILVGPGQTYTETYSGDLYARTDTSGTGYLVRKLKYGSPL